MQCCRSALETRAQRNFWPSTSCHVVWARRSSVAEGVQNQGAESGCRVRVPIQGAVSPLGPSIAWGGDGCECHPACRPVPLAVL